MGTNEKYILSSVRNALRILKSYSTYEPTKKVSELANSLGLAKSTVSRIMSTLASEGFVEKDPDTNAYRLGLSLLTLGGIVSINIDVNTEAIPVLNNLMTKTGETAHLAILDGLDTIYIQKKECNHPVRILTHLGRRNPAYCTSSGKVLLAFSKDDILEKVIQNGLKAFSKNTITDPVKLKKQIKLIREQGYAISTEELTEGTRSIAAPVFDYTGKVICAINIVGPIMRLQDHKLPSLIRHVKDAAKEVSKKMGYDEKTSQKNFNHSYFR
jgi:DNA-binding IclR family transcriptional regulator